MYEKLANIMSLLGVAIDEYEHSTAESDFRLMQLNSLTFKLVI